MGSVGVGPERGPLGDAGQCLRPVQQRGASFRQERNRGAGAVFEDVFP